MNVRSTPRYAARIATAALLGACETGPEATPYELESATFPIIGGGFASEGEYPFMVSVEAGDGLCGGSIVSARHILTAAHCVAGLTPSQVKVVLGRTTLSDTTKGARVSIADIRIHPEYDASTDRYDVAVLRLTTPTTIAPVAIASNNAPAERSSWSTGAVAEAIGWGRTTCEPYSGSDTLKELELSMLADAVPWAGFDLATMVAADAAGTTAQTYKGDSGSPVMVRNGWGDWLVAGVVSWGPCDGVTEGYSRVGAATLRRWISTVIHETPFVADVDGDKKADIITFTHNAAPSIYVALSDTNKFKPSKVWHTNFGHAGYVPLVGDITGDGRADVLAVAKDSVWVGESSGSNFTTAGFKTTGVGAGYAVPKVGDVDADGDDDLVLFSHDAAQDVHVLLSNRTSFGAKKKWAETFGPEQATVDLGDVNGDKRADAVAFTHAVGGGAVHVALATAAGNFAPATLWKSAFATVSGIPSLARLGTDLRADLVLFERGTTADVRIAQSLTTTSAFGATSLAHSNFAGGLTRPAVGDVTGDGKADIVEFSQDETGDVWVATGSGTAFGTRLRWHDFFAP